MFIERVRGFWWAEVKHLVVLIRAEKGGITKVKNGAWEP